MLQGLLPSSLGQGKARRSVQTPTVDLCWQAEHKHKQQEQEAPEQSTTFPLHQQQLQSVKNVWPCRLLLRLRVVL